MADLPDLAQSEIAIVERTNAFRQSERLEPVVRNRELDAAARAFAQYLAKSGRFAHEADGRQPAERAGAAGYAFCMVAENLALNLDSRGFTVEALTRQTMEGWKQSPSHRKNLELPFATEIGVGIAQAPGPEPRFLTVQLLGRPRSLAYDFRIANRTTEALTYSVGGKTHSLEPAETATHSLCEPADLVFQRSGSWMTGTRLDARYKARSGALFVARPGSDGRVRIELTR